MTLAAFADNRPLSPEASGHLRRMLADPNAFFHEGHALCLVTEDELQELRQLSEEAARSTAARKDEDVEAWAERLARDLAAFND